MQKYEDKTIRKTIFISLGKALLLTILSIVINLLVEISFSRKISDVSIDFDRGYLTVNEKVIGNNLLAEGIMFLVVFFLILNYFNDYHRNGYSEV